MQTIDGRIPPHLPPAAMKTFRVAAPLSTHWRPATCAEVECAAYLHGWVTAIDEATPLGQAQAAWIRRESGRGFTERRNPAGLTEFIFAPGQQGFASAVAAQDHSRHRIRLDREERFLLVGGDWRGNPTGERVEYPDAEAWQGEFEAHQERIRSLTERG